jgi:hypothetical protein
MRGSRAPRTVPARQPATSFAPQIMPYTYSPFPVPIMRSYPKGGDAMDLTGHMGPCHQAQRIWDAGLGTRPAHRCANAGASSSQMMQGKPAGAIALSWKSGVAVAVQPQLSSQLPFRQGDWVCGEGDAMAGFQRGYFQIPGIFQTPVPWRFLRGTGKGIGRSGVCGKWEWGVEIWSMVCYGTGEGRKVQIEFAPILGVQLRRLLVKAGLKCSQGPSGLYFLSSKSLLPVIRS